MTELEYILRTIYDEKQTKLLPQNIKSGVTILGVTGTYTGEGVVISQAQVELMISKLPTLNEVLTELGIITAPTAIDTLGYACSNMDTTNNSIDITVNTLDTYTIDGNDNVYDSNGDKIYPVETPVE